MKHNIKFFGLLAILILTTGTIRAKVTTHTNKVSQASDSLDIINVYDAPNVFADDMTSYTVPSYNIYTSNIFADDVFADDVVSNDVLIANVISAGENANDEGTGNLEINGNTANGAIDIKAVSTGKFYYYTDPHTDKSGNIINGGMNTLFVKKVLYPGVYSCKLDAADGSTKDVMVVCKL